MPTSNYWQLLAIAITTLLPLTPLVATPPLPGAPSAWCMVEFNHSNLALLSQLIWLQRKHGQENCGCSSRLPRDSYRQCWNMLEY